MTIRPATKKDIEPIRVLNTKIFEEINTRCNPDIVPQFAQTQAGEKYFIDAFNRADGCFFVAENHEGLIGYVSGGAKPFTYRKSRYFEIDNLGVTPEYQNQGIGKQLLNTIASWAKDHGYQKIYIESYFKNTKAIAFYKKHGYQEIEISLEKEI